MNVKPLFIISFIFLLCVSSIAHAGSHQLSTRQLPSGEYEAVITFSNQDYCFINVNPPSSIQIIEYDVLITSPGPDVITCIGKAPPEVLYEATAIIGELAPGKYTVTWNQERSFSLFTLLRVSDASPIPSSSTWALFLLILGFLIVAYFTPRLRPRSGPK